MEKRYHVLLIDSEDGGVTVEVPALPGCISEGATREEALENIKEAIQAYLESLVERGQPIPEDVPVVEVVEVSVPLPEKVRR